MASNPESQPLEQSSDDNYFEGVSSETEQLRADGVEKLMNEGFPHGGEPGAEQYYRIWDTVDAYVTAVRSDSTIDETLSRYLQDPEHARAFNDVVGDLKTGQAPADFISAQEGRPPDLHRLSALIAFDGVAKAAIRSEGGKRRGAEEQLRDTDLTGAEGEAARRFIRVAEILDVESNAIMITSEVNPLDIKEVGADYAQRFDTFSQRRDVPSIYRERAREMAANLRIDALRDETSSSTKAPVVSEQEATTVETVPVKPLFGQEGVVKPEDAVAIKNHAERLMGEANPKNAYELAKLLADAKRAGIRLTGGKEKVTKFLEDQRAVMQAKGPRALAQYLVYCRYTGLGGEPTGQEQAWLMGALHDRLKNDPEHKGLSRLSMNMNYLKVEGYSPDLVRQGVREEITALKAAGNFDMALQEAARARTAGVEVNDLLVRTDTKFVDEIDRRSQELAAENKWDVFARLRNAADVVWQHVDLGINNKAGLVKYFEQARFLAQGRDTWGAYASYAADARELSDKDERLQNAPSGEQVAQWVEEDTPAERTAELQKERVAIQAKEGRDMDIVRPRAVVEGVAVESPEETPDFREISQPVESAGWLSGVRSFFSRLFGAEERAAARQAEELERARILADLGRLQQQQAAEAKQKSGTPDNTPYDTAA